MGMGTDWSLSDNSATFTDGGQQDTLRRVLNCSEKLSTRQGAGPELLEESIPGLSAPGPIEDELELFAKRYPDLVIKVGTPGTGNTNGQKKVY